jgi:hypothetical protein
VKSVLVGKLDNKKLYYIIDADGTRSDGVLVDDLGKKELINFWRFVRNEPRVKRMMNSDFHKFLWQDSQNQREKALWNNVFIAKAFLPDDELLQTVPIKDDILGRKSVLHGLMNRALDFDITRRSNTVEEKAIRGRLGSAIGRAFKPKRSTGKKFVRRSMEEIEGVLDPRKRRDSDGDGMIFDGTSREMPDPARAASTTPMNTLSSVTADSQLPDVDGPLINVDARRKRVTSQIRAISSSTGIPASISALSEFMRRNFASKFGFKKMKDKLNAHELEAFEHWNNGVVPKTVAEAHEILAKIHPTYIMNRPARHDELQKHVSFDFLLDKDATEELESWQTSLLASHLLFLKEAENLPNSPIGHNFYYMDLDRAEKVSAKVARDLMAYIRGDSSMRPLPMGFQDLKLQLGQGGQIFRVSNPAELSMFKNFVDGELQGLSNSDKRQLLEQIGKWTLNQTQGHIGYSSGVSGYWGFKPGLKIGGNGKVEKLYAPGHIVAYQRAESELLSQIGLPREEATNSNISILDLFRLTQQTGNRIAVTAWLSDEDEITSKKLSAKKEELAKSLKNLEKQLKDKERQLKISSDSGIFSPEQNVNMQKDIVEARQEIEKLVAEIADIEEKIDVDTPERRAKKAKDLSEMLALTTAHHEHGHGHEYMAIYNEVEKAVLARRDARINELKTKGGSLSREERNELNLLSSATDHRELWSWYQIDQIENGPEESFKESLSSSLEEISAYGFLERYETLFLIDPQEQGLIEGFHGAVLVVMKQNRQNAADTLAENKRIMQNLARQTDPLAASLLEKVKEDSEQLEEDIKNIDTALADFQKQIDLLNSQPLFDPKTRSTVKVSEEQRKKFNKLFEDYARILESMPDSAIPTRSGPGSGAKLAAVVRQAKLRNDELTTGELVAIISAGRVLSMTNIASGARFITMSQDANMAPQSKGGFSQYGGVVDGLARNSNQFAVIKDLMRNGLPEVFGDDSEANAQFARALQSMGMTARAGHMFQVAQNPTDLGFGTDPESGMTLPSLDMDPSEAIQHLANLAESDSLFAEGRNSSMSPHDGSVLLLGDGSNIGLENFIASLYSDSDIMEKARTKPWGELWDSLTPEQKIVVRRGIAEDVRIHQRNASGSGSRDKFGYALFEKISQQFSLDDLNPDEKALIKGIVKKIAVAGGESYVEKQYRRSSTAARSGIEVLSYLGEYGYRELPSELNTAIKSGMDILGGQALTPEETAALTKYATWLLHSSTTNLEQSIKSENYIVVDNKRTIVGAKWTK